MTISKTCTKCNETKTLDAFSKHATCRYGRAAQCKACKGKDPQSLAVKAAYDKDYRTANLTKVSATAKAYAISNPDRVAATKGKWKAKVRSPMCIPKGFDFEATVPFYAERNRLAKETGVEHHVDHIVALVNGGLHEASNLQVLTAEENLAKATTEREQNVNNTGRYSVR